MGDLARILKAILHQNPKGISNIVAKLKSLREKVIDCLLQLIKTEIDGLCSVKNPSILRKTTKKERAERAPIFYLFLHACCSKCKGTAKDFEWFPAMAVAGSVLLKQRNLLYECFSFHNRTNCKNQVVAGESARKKNMCDFTRN